MSRYILDTDTLSLHQQGHSLVIQRVKNHAATDVLITAITCQEQIEGWLARLHQARTPDKIAAAYDLFTHTIVPSVIQFPVLSFTEPAIQRFEQLLTLKLNVGRMDLRIAAIALEHAATVVTRNQRDFARVPGLVIEDWSV